MLLKFEWLQRLTLLSSQCESLKSVFPEVTVRCVTGTGKLPAQLHVMHDARPPLAEPSDWA